MKRLALIGGILALVALGFGGLSRAQEQLGQRDAQGPVAVTITLTAAPMVGIPVKARVALDTHSVDLDSISFGDAVTLKDSGGAERHPTSVEEMKGGGHHREAMLVLPPPARPGRLSIFVRGVGGTTVRQFYWNVAPR